MVLKSRRFVGYNLLFLAFGAFAMLIIVGTSIIYSRRTRDFAADAGAIRDLQIRPIRTPGFGRRLQ